MYTCIHIYICIYIYIHTHTYIYKHTIVYIYMHMYIFLLACLTRCAPVHFCIADDEDSLDKIRKGSFVVIFLSTFSSKLTF